MLKSDLAGKTLALQHVVEETCTSNVPINQSVREVVAGMGLQIGNAASVPVEKRHFVHSEFRCPEEAIPCIVRNGSYCRSKSARLRGEAQNRISKQRGYVVLYCCCVQRR